jgi:2-keto-3-deoxy-L-rhamnonate aldolase RhmA
VRLGIGLGFVGVAFGLLWIVRGLQPAPGEEGPLWQLLLIASIGGWYSACGGAFKDAPIEGFEWFKFFRSPVSAGFYGFLVSHFTESYPLVTLCAIGYTVATLETYKTFFFPSKPRGKFAGKPILYPEMLEKRQYFVPVYVLIWLGLVTSFTVAFVQLGRDPSSALERVDRRHALVELWRAGVPGFGVFVPNERAPDERGPDGERLEPLYTVEGGRRLAASPLYDYVFLNLEGAYDPSAVAAIAEGLRASGEMRPKSLLVRIPPISADGEAAARMRVVEALERGADGIVLPHVRSVAEARAAVAFFAGLDVWSPDNVDGTVLAMLMLEDPDAVAVAAEIADIPGYSVLACGIGSLTRALEGDRAAAEAGNLEVLAHAIRVGKPDMITAGTGDVTQRLEEGFLGLLMSGAEADAAIEIGRAAAGR